MEFKEIDGHRFRILSEQDKQIRGIKEDKDLDQTQCCTRCLMKLSYYEKHKLKCKTKNKED